LEAGTKDLVNSKIVRVRVRVQGGGGEFDAEVEVPESMPLSFFGAFTRLPSKNPGDSELAESLLRSEPTGGGSSHIMWFHGNGDGYQFTMFSDKTLEFKAEHLSINPVTGMPGFRR